MDSEPLTRPGAAHGKAAPARRARASGDRPSGREPPPPIFVVAGPQTHGALVAAMLGRNPAAFGLPETGLTLAGSVDNLLHELTGLRGVQLHGLLRVLAHLLSGEQSVASVEMAWRWLLTHSHWPTAWVFDFLCARIAPSRAVERVTASLFDPIAMKRLVERHSDARYVHVVRHPRRHGEAMMAGGGAAARLLGSYDEDVSPPELDPQILWLRAERAADALRAGLPRGAWRRVRVEDVLRSPDATLARLCRGLGLPHDPASLARMRRPEEGPFAGFGPLGAHLGDEPEFLAEPRPPRAEPPSRLSGPLSWRQDGTGFRPEVVERARAYGYR